MNNLEVKSAIEKMFKLNNDFKFIFENGDDCADTFIIRFLGETYVEGYQCDINVILNLSSGMWDVSVNGFNTLNSIGNEIELVFAIRQQIKFSRTPCPDQVLSKSDEFSY